MILSAFFDYFLVSQQFRSKLNPNNVEVKRLTGTEGLVSEYFYLNSIFLLHFEKMTIIERGCHDMYLG